MVTLRARVLDPMSASAVRWLDDAVIAIDDAGVIAHVGPFDGRAVDEDVRAGVITPGFVDAHVHYPQTRIVGAASGPLLEWLAKSTFPEEARFADRDHAARIATVFAQRLASAGTTLAFVYGPVFPAASDALLAELERTGQRAVVGPVLMDRGGPDALMLDAGPALDALAGLAETWHGRDGRLGVAAIPRFALSCSLAMMRGAADLAEQRGLWTSTHLSESVAECDVARALFGADDYLRVYEDAGLVGARSVFAHCIHLSDSEWDRLAAARAVVAHCPDSNAFLGSGRMRTDAVLDRGVPLALGSDIAAGRGFRVTRALSYAYDNALAVGRPVTPAALLWWGTRGGALALGHAEVGRVDVGLDADLVLHAVPEWIDGEESALGAILFDADLPLPRRTWVRGRVVGGTDRSAV